MSTTKSMLVLSWGKYEGARVCNILFGTEIFSLECQEMENKVTAKYDKRVELTNVPVLVGQETEHVITAEIRKKLNTHSYNTIIVIMRYVIYLNSLLPVFFFFLQLQICCSPISCMASSVFNK